MRETYLASTNVQRGKTLWNWLFSYSDSDDLPKDEAAECEAELHRIMSDATPEERREIDDHHQMLRKRRWGGGTTTH